MRVMSAAELRATRRRTATAIAGALALVAGGCASGGPCRDGAVGGWLSGWSSASGSAFTTGLHTVWDGCGARAARPPQGPRAWPAPSADPRFESPAGVMPPPP